MIIITSEVFIADEYWEQALELAHCHVKACREEEGCIATAV